MQVLLDETRMREDRRALEKCLSLVAMRLAVHEGKMHLGWQGSMLAVMLVNMHNCNQQNSLWSVQTEKEFTKGHSQKPERSRELASGALKPDNNAQMTQGYPGHSSGQCQAEPGAPLQRQPLPQEARCLHGQALLYGFCVMPASWSHSRSHVP